MKRYLVVLSVVLTAIVGVGTALSAHHSFAATYHEGQSITIEGELVQFLFRNPHSFVHINVTEKDGTVRRHAAEWGGASQLGGQGVNAQTLKVGDRVVNPFPISCGNCLLCKEGLFSLCENSNPNSWMAEQMWGFSPAGIFGYSHLTGGYAGGQAQYARIPFADVGPIKVPDELTDEQVLFLSDIFPTGYMAAEACDV